MLLPILILCAAHSLPPHDVVLDGATIRVHLEPIDLRSDSFQFLVPDERGHLEPRPAPGSIPLRGTSIDAPNVIITGRRNVDGSLRFIRFKELAGPRAWRMDGDDPLRLAHPVTDDSIDGRCGSDLLPSLPAPPAEGGIAGGGCAVRCEIGFDLDWEFYSDMGLDEVAAAEAVEDSLNEVDALFSTQLSCEFELTGMIVRTDQATDPYYGLDGAGNLLDTLRVTWNPAGFPIPHDVGHLISGTYASDGILGLAWVTAVCQSYRYGMSRTTAPGVIAHEVGHNFSLGHCIDPACTTMCGACMDFGPISAAQARSYIASRWCIEQIDAIVAPVPPYCHPDTSISLDGELVQLNVLANDVDGNCDDLTLVGVDAVTSLGGTVLLTGNSLLYAPPANATGEDLFSYVVADGTGREATGSVTVGVYRSVMHVGFTDCSSPTVHSIASAFAAFHPTIGGRVVIGPGTWPANISWTGSGAIALESTHGPDATILNGAASSSLLAFDVGTADVTITGITFAGGATPDSGGAANIAAGTARFDSCRFIECSSHTAGGAIAFTGDVLLLNNCRFDRCSSLEGGAVHAVATFSANATRCDFLANIGFDRAGAIYADTAIMRLTESIIAQSVSPVASAIYSTDIARLTDSFVCGTGSDIVVATTIDLDNSIISGTCACEGLPWTAPVDCDANGVDDRCQILDDPMLDADENGLLDACAISIPTVPVRWSAACGGNDHFYEVRVDTVSWPIARLTAILRGGTLVSINDATEQTFVYELTEHIDAAFYGTTGPWIGLYLQVTEWTWLDGTPLTFEFWGSGQPQWDDGAAVLGSDGWWRGLPLNETAPAYVIEYSSDDCDEDGAPDAWEIAMGFEIDANNDGIPDSCAPPGDPADLNGDGIVDGGDLGLMLANWGEPGTSDLDGDGDTDGGDLGLLLASWSS
jgi:hypothetical protein